MDCRSNFIVLDIEVEKIGVKKADILCRKALSQE